MYILLYIQSTPWMGYMAMHVAISYLLHLIAVDSRFEVGEVGQVLCGGQHNPLWHHSQCTFMAVLTITSLSSGLKEVHRYWLGK